MDVNPVGHDHAHGEEHDAHAADNAKSYTIHHSIDHGDHSDEVVFEVASSRNGSVGDVMGFYDVSITNRAWGIFIGVLLAFLFCDDHERRGSRRLRDDERMPQAVRHHA